MVVGWDQLEIVFMVIVEYLLFSGERGFCVVCGVCGDIKEVGYQGGLVGCQLLVDIVLFLYFFYYVWKKFCVGGFVFFFYVYEFYVGFILGFYLVFYYQCQCDDKGVGDGEFWVKQVGVVICGGLEECYFWIIFQMVVCYLGYVFFFVMFQVVNFQMIGGDLYIKVVIDILIVQILIGVQFIWYVVYFVWVWVYKFVYQFDQFGSIKDMCWNIGIVQ